ncbi:MAG: hypothetical protein ACXW1Y_07065 [Acidimicrobiia bacterium]
MSSLGTRTTRWLRYLHDTQPRVGRSVDPVGFASGVGKRSLSFDRAVFDRVDSEELSVL